MTHISLKYKLNQYNDFSKKKKNSQNIIFKILQSSKNVSTYICVIIFSY